MIPQVCNPNVDGIVKDPRRKAQRVQFNQHAMLASNITYKSNYKEEYEKQQRNALATSLLVVLGALFFATAYFMFSGLKNAGK